MRRRRQLGLWLLAMLTGYLLVWQLSLSDVHRMWFFVAYLGQYALMIVGTVKLHQLMFEKR